MESRVFACDHLDNYCPTHASHVDGITGSLHHAQLIGWEGDLTNFLLELTFNYDPIDLCFPNRWNDRYEPLNQAFLFTLNDI
jgi:hypothetical protein